MRCKLVSTGAGGSLTVAVAGGLVGTSIPSAAAVA